VRQSCRGERNSIWYCSAGRVYPHFLSVSPLSCDAGLVQWGPALRTAWQSGFRWRWASLLLLWIREAKHNTQQKKTSTKKTQYSNNKTIPSPWIIISFYLSRSSITVLYCYCNNQLFPNKIKLNQRAPPDPDPAIFFSGF